MPNQALSNRIYYTPVGQHDNAEIIYSGGGIEEDGRQNHRAADKRAADNGPPLYMRFPKIRIPQSYTKLTLQAGKSVTTLIFGAMRSKRARDPEIAGITGSLASLGCVGGFGRCKIQSRIDNHESWERGYKAVMVARKIIGLAGVRGTQPLENDEVVLKHELRDPRLQGVIGIARGLVAEKKRRSSGGTRRNLKLGNLKKAEILDGG
ncbi:hypothetical protein K438DRAFT_1773304 [Mycena galopus ATCC 62051]|nr:hypothetical protein K438DRAFT_1773304 [Mycena galopus ATCC 62051]